MVNSVVEMEVSRAVSKARLLERALHGSAAAWEMAYADMRVPAVRTVTEDGVHFRGEFPERCAISDAPKLVTLIHEGVEMAVRTIEAPGDNGFVVEWGFAARVTTTLA